MKNYKGKNLVELSYEDLANMGIPEEVLDRELFGSDYSYYQNPDDGDIYEFEGDKFCGHWTKTCFMVWFSED